MRTNINTKRNYLYNVICELITTLIPLVTTPHVTRILDRDGMGAYQYVMTIASYFVLFAGFGVKAYGNRCIAQVRENQVARDRMFSGIFYEQLLVSSAVGLLYFFYVITLGGEYRMLFAIFGINLLSAALEITWLYYGMESFAPTACCTILIKLLVAVGIFAFVKTHEDVWVYALLSSLGVLGVQVVLWLGVHRYVHFVRVPSAEIKKHFMPCAALLIPMLAPTLYRSMDKLMLETMVDKNAVGLYSTAEQLQTCMLGFITALGTVMLPRVSNLLSKGRERDAHVVIDNSMQFSVFLGCAFAFGIAAVADVFVPYYFGASFAEASILTIALAPTIVLLSWAEVIRSQYIIPHKRDSIFLVSVLCGAGINLICNLIFVPLCIRNAELLGMSSDAAGTLGAMPGTLFAECSVLVVQYCFLRHVLPYRRYIRACLIFPAAGGVMLLTVHAAKWLLQLCRVDRPLILLVAEVFVGGIVYLMICGGWYIFFRRDTFKKFFS